MKAASLLNCFWLSLFLGGLMAGFHPQARAGDSIVIFETGFEAEEGYDPDFTLIGQNDWVGEGSGGNGLLEGFFPGLGQQAFIGFSPPEEGHFLNVWRPLTPLPFPPDRQVLKFSVLMEIVDSTNDRYDDFRWSVYNTEEERLFTLDFQLETFEISYILDTGGFVPTGFFFRPGRIHELVIYINLARNLWTALLDGFVVVNAQPMTTQDAALILGDINAVWAVLTPGEPGDNFMIFDNYRVTAESVSFIPPVLEAFGLEEGEFIFRVYGEPGLDHTIEVSTDLREWFVLGTFRSPPGGIFDFQDDTAPEHAASFYRVAAR